MSCVVLNLYQNATHNFKSTKIILMNNHVASITIPSNRRKFRPSLIRDSNRNQATGEGTSSKMIPDESLPRMGDISRTPPNTGNDLQFLANFRNMSKITEINSLNHPI